jgi:hypothetical protein
MIASESSNHPLMSTTSLEVPTGRSRREHRLDLVEVTTSQQQSSTNVYDLVRGDDKTQQERARARPRKR